MPSIPEKMYGLIGHPLTHSFSENYFNQKFAAENINAEYRNFDIPEIDFLMEIIAQYDNLNGLNVTLPYKELIIPYLDSLDDDAKEIGAVNVVKFIHSKEGLKLKGYNSDVIGFTNSINSMLTEHHKSALVLGTGGAAKAVAYSLKKLGINVRFVSRKKTASTLIYEELTKNDIKESKIIVNATPLGMYPKVDECPDIPYRFITPQHLCYDLIYNPQETLFLKKCKEKGATIKNGLEMLLLQAFASYDIWTK